jgi:hypothetical protein
MWPWPYTRGRLRPATLVLPRAAADRQAVVGERLVQGGWGGRRHEKEGLEKKEKRLGPTQDFPIFRIANVVVYHKRALWCRGLRYLLEMPLVTSTYPNEPQ